MIVSAAMNAGGVSYRAFDPARATDRLAMSQAVFDEVDAVLRRSTLARFTDPTLRTELLDQLLSATDWFLPAMRVADCRDPNDDKYLELAPAAHASRIVSGDQDLLVLHPWRGIAIVRPADYLAGCPAAALTSPSSPHPRTAERR